MSTGDFGGADEGLELELDMPAQGARRPVRRAEDEPDEPAGRRSRSRRSEPSAEDLAHARRMAAYGEAPGLVGSVFYALNVGPRRRQLRRELADAEQRWRQAIAEAEAGYLELGRSLHRRTHEVDMSPVQLQVTKADHATMRWEQVKHEKRTKQERELAKKRVDDAHRQLAEAVVQGGLERLDPEGTKKLLDRVSAANRLKREVQLRKLGIDSYDHAAVSRGWTLLLVVLLVLAGTAAFAVLR